MTFAVGSLVKARGREWVVLPESENDLLILRPLGGTEDEVTGIFLPLENVESAHFALPTTEDIGDHFSCRLLRDAIRLGFRSSAGPFRSFGKISVEPRPYQLVPLLLALRLDPVRLLIADDVGIGKTIEAALIAKEIMERGETNGMAVLCPPHLAEQWQEELKDKFNIDAELVLSSTAARLERNCGANQSLFDVYPHIVVSVDFIKTDRRRDDFLRACPDLVIVDEAHTCAFGDSQKGSRHQRYQLINGLSKKKDRHLILVTATPHSGKEETFRSLLGLLEPAFVDLPLNLMGKENESHRRNLARYFVQRRRADIRHFMKSDTPFPEREEQEVTYKLSPEYKKFFDRVLAYTRESVRGSDDNKVRQRVRWWSALALLRSIASSPAAAEATLRNRAATCSTETPEEADEIGQRIILDMEEEGYERLDTTPGCDFEEGENNLQRRKLLEMAKQAKALRGDKDIKLTEAAKIIGELVKENYHPIIFCRFIDTAEYVAEGLRERLSKNIEIASVTGTLPPMEREERVSALAKSKNRVLVCTDCLSEGINLQESFDAVFHYDLAWNPTRHEQREGRVDRYRQPKSVVRVVQFYGIDNQIDGIVLEVLIRKHKTIRSSLGISVPIPVNTNQIIEAVFEGLLLREGSSDSQPYLPGFDQILKPQTDKLFGEWEKSAEREKRSRTMFAQEAIKVDEVEKELTVIQAAIGSGVDVENFTREGFRAHKAVVSGNELMEVDLSEVVSSLKEVIRTEQKFKARFKLPVEEKVIYLHRTHPVVEGLATHIVDTALDSKMKSIANRAGVIRTGQVDRRTTLLLVRFRYHIVVKKNNEEKQLLAEDCQLVGFSGAPANASWLTEEESETLMTASPSGNILPDLSRDALQKILDGFDSVRPKLDEVARGRGKQLLESHRRVRKEAKDKGITYSIEPKLPPDVLGIYIFLPIN